MHAGNLAHARFWDGPREARNVVGTDEAALSPGRHEPGKDHCNCGWHAVEDPVRHCRDLEQKDEYPDRQDDRRYDDPRHQPVSAERLHPGDAEARLIEPLRTEVSIERGTLSLEGRSGKDS